MSLRAFEKFARFVFDLKDWTEITAVDTRVKQWLSEEELFLGLLLALRRDISWKQS